LLSVPPGKDTQIKNKQKHEIVQIRGSFFGVFLIDAIISITIETKKPMMLANPMNAIIFHPSLKNIVSPKTSNVHLNLQKGGDFYGG
jgi:hypothetical protein